MDKRFESLTKLVIPLANNIVARIWPHEDFHNLCDQLISFYCINILKDSDSQDLDRLADLVLWRLESVIPLLSELLQASLQNQTQINLAAFGQQILFRITDLLDDN